MFRNKLLNLWVKETYNQENQKIFEQNEIGNTMYEQCYVATEIISRSVIRIDKIEQDNPQNSLGIYWYLDYDKSEIAECFNN